MTLLQSIQFNLSSFRHRGPEPKDWEPDGLIDGMMPHDILSITKLAVHAFATTGITTNSLPFYSILFIYFISFWSTPRYM